MILQIPIRKAQIQAQSTHLTAPCGFARGRKISRYKTVSVMNLQPTVQVSDRLSSRYAFKRDIFMRGQSVF